MFTKCTLHLPGFAMLALLVSPCVFAAESEGEDTGDTQLSIAFNLTDGSSETKSVIVGARTKLDAENNQWFLGGDFSYGEEEDNKTVENGKVYTQYNWLFSERSFMNIRVEALYDDISEIDYRVIAGPPGLGYYLIKNDNTSFSAGAGLSYVWEEVGDITDDYPALRLSERLEQKLSETATLWESVAYLPEIEDFDNYLITGEIGIDAAINAHMSLQVVAKDRYDSVPAEDAEQNDVSINAGIVFRM